MLQPQRVIHLAHQRHRSVTQGLSLPSICGPQQVPRGSQVSEAIQASPNKVKHSMYRQTGATPCPSPDSSKSVQNGEVKNVATAAFARV
jgi:hypothetical protein